MNTTILKKNTSIKTEKLENCHDGSGSLEFKCLIDTTELPSGSLLKYVHDDILSPNTSIGHHTHHDREEYYYILSGHGTMVLDGEQHEVSAGDFTGVFPGGSHALINNGKEELRIMVIGIDRDLPKT